MNDETNAILSEIARELKGIRKELNYMNGVEMTVDGHKLSRDAMEGLSKTFEKKR